MGKSRSRVRALGTAVDALTLHEAVDVVVSWLRQDTQPNLACRYVVTPNLDHAVILSQNEEFRAAYRDAALVLPDGTPLLWSARLNGRALPERVAGSDLGPAVLRAAPAGTPVFLLGGMPDASERAAAAIERDYPAVRLVGRSSPPFGFEKDETASRELVEAIRATGARLVIVGLGAPKQELWVHAHKDELPGTVVLCIGATIDFLAGTKKRAPVWMQRAGLEWAHRAFSEPRRLLLRYGKDAVYLPGLLVRDLVRRSPDESGEG